MSSDAHLHRAARSGRRLLHRALPAALFPWLESLALESDSPDEVWATAGALGAIGLALEKAYHESGSEVRELIWALHRLLREGDAARGRVKGLEGCEPWLLERLAARPSGNLACLDYLLRSPTLGTKGNFLFSLKNTNENTEVTDPLAGYVQMPNPLFTRKPA
ncbi:hypothetical protein IIC65_06525 [Candidatus Sumerlaeota bacterium]|nr:hypothetical protein [Candidatus Sumerlaeota bacterium]